MSISPDKLYSIQECEEIIARKPYPSDPVVNAFRQLADTMRENERLREALDTIAEATRFLKGDVAIYTIAKDALEPNPHKHTLTEGQIAVFNSQNATKTPGK